MRRLVGLSLAALALSTQVACLFWPFPTGDLLGGRGRITRQYAAPLQVGVATREDVLLRLGEPDEVLEGGRVLVYRWTEARGFFLVGGGGGQVIPFPGHRALRLEYGPDARLLGLRFEQGAPEPPTAPEPSGGS